MYREWKKTEFQKKYYIWIWEQQGWEVDQEIDGKMKWGRMADQLVEKGGREEYITVRNGRSSWERQGIVAFSTFQRNEWMYTSPHLLVRNHGPNDANNKYPFKLQNTRCCCFYHHPKARQLHRTETLYESGHTITSAMLWTIKETMYKLCINTSEIICLKGVMWN